MTPSWVKSLFGRASWPNNIPLSGATTDTIERYYPDKTTKPSAKHEPVSYSIDVLDIATNILPEVKAELNAHYHCVHFDVASIIPRNIEKYLNKHPNYTSWNEQDLTKEYFRLVYEHFEIFKRQASTHLVDMKIKIPGEPSSPASLTRTAIALVAMRSHTSSDASEEEKRQKTLEIQRHGIDSHRSHVKSYMHARSSKVAELGAGIRQGEKAEATLAIDGKKRDFEDNKR